MPGRMDGQPARTGPIGPAVAAPTSGTGAEALPVTVLVVLAAAVFTAITTEVLPVGLLPVISAGLHTSESRVGLLVSAYAGVVVLGSIPLAAVVVRWPRRTVLCTLLVTYALSNAVMATAGAYWIALVARLLGGLAHAGFFSVVFAAAVSVAPAGRQGRAIALVGAGTAAALALGVPLGTAVGTAIGWRWAFAACAIAMVAFAVLTALVLPTQPPPARSAQQPVLAAVRTRPLLAAAAVTVVLTLGHYTPFTYISPLLRHAGVSVTGVSLVLLGYGAAGILGLVVSGAVVDRHPRRGLQAATALTTTCLLILGLAPHGAPGTVAVLAWGFAFGTLPTLIQAVALRAAAQAPDAAPAVVNTAFNIGIAGGALLGARELLVTTPPGLALTGAALTAVALVLLLARAGGEPPEVGEA
jgi:DHA1 family inner membrane transport protein